MKISLTLHLLIFSVLQIPEIYASDWVKPEDLLEGNEISEEGLELTCASRSYEDPRTKDVFAQLLVARLSGIPEFTKPSFQTTVLVTLSRLQEGKWSFEYGSPFSN